MDCFNKHARHRNYSALIEQIIRSPKGGLATCPVVISTKKLDRLIDQMNENGWAAQYVIMTDHQGKEVVRFYWKWEGK